MVQSQKIDGNLVIKVSVHSILVIYEYKNKVQSSSFISGAHFTVRILG